MAMRAVMMKISPKTRFMEGLTVLPRRFGSSVEDRRVLNNEEVGCDLEKLVKDGSKVTEATRVEWWENVGKRRSAIDKRWEKWVESSHELWKKKNEEEQRRELDLRWTYLKDLLHREGIDTSHHRLLVSMKIIEPDDASASDSEGPDDASVNESEERIIELKIGSPDRGLVSINRLALDWGRAANYLHWYLPRQTVNGLLCFTKHRAFLIYNPMTEERSPWVETKRTEPSKYNSICFGFNPQSDEHKVIWISSNETGSDQVVNVFTVGKNTWRKIDAIPPIAISEHHEGHFYVDGCLYWRFRRKDEDGELEQIMRFDIVTEKFTVIPIPGFVIDPKEYKWSQTVELTEIDGRIAVLHWICEITISLWTFHEDADGGIKWTEEVIKMPPHWNGKDYLSIEALTGTNLIFLRSENSNSLFYYNRKTKESIRFPSSPDLIPLFDLERIVQL